MFYDAIAGREGCEADSGNDWFGLKAFTEVCVWPHDETSEIFNQPPTVSYSFGPHTKGDPDKPFLTGWAAWVATVGVRVGQETDITLPADNLGENSTLYLEAKPPQLTHAWNVEGLLAIAIQKTSDRIELKHYLDNTGEFETHEWRGLSPCLFYSGHVVHGDPSNRGQLVCYYILPGFPKTLYARFESDDFAVERVVMPSLRMGLARLINAYEVETTVMLFALDDRGRDVTLTSPEHPALFDQDMMGVETSPPVGAIFNIAVNTGKIGFDKANIDISRPSGAVYKLLIDPAKPPPADEMSLSVALVGGEITL